MVRCIVGRWRDFFTLGIGADEPKNGTAGQDLKFLPSVKRVFSKHEK
jgi:hypothetical protein